MKNMVVLLACLSAATTSAQLRAQAAPPSVPAQNVATDAATGSRELNKLFDDYWQDKLKHNPEYATILGDKRYDAELTDYSPAAVNAALARARQLSERPSGMNTTGLSRQEQPAAHLLLRSLTEDQV